jgi:hypothetical protein
VDFPFANLRRVADSSRTLRIEYSKGPEGKGEESREGRRLQNRAWSSGDPRPAFFSLIDDHYRCFGCIFNGAGVAARG